MKSFFSSTDLKTNAPAVSFAVCITCITVHQMFSNQPELAILSSAIRTWLSITRIAGLLSQETFPAARDA